MLAGLVERFPETVFDYARRWAALYGESPRPRQVPSQKAVAVLAPILRAKGLVSEQFPEPTVA